MNLKSLIASTAIALAAIGSAATAATISIDAGGVLASDTDSFLGTVNGFDLNVTTSQLAIGNQAYLSSNTINITGGTGALEIEVSEDFSILGGDLAMIHATASVSNAPNNGTVGVEHFIDFGFGELAFADFDFGGAIGGQEESGQVDPASGNFTVRTVYSIFKGASAGIDTINVNADISVNTVPVPAAGFLLLGGLGGLAAMRRRKTATAA